MVFKERQYKVVRRKLDDLGYPQPLSMESLQLTEKLLSDLVRNKEGYHHYKSVARGALERCEELEKSVGPFKTQNEKLIKESNELHRKLIEVREETDKTIRELREKITDLENSNADLDFVNNEHLMRIGELQECLAAEKRKNLNPGSARLKTKEPECNRNNKTKLMKSPNDINTINDIITKVTHSLSTVETANEMKKLKNERAKLLSLVEDLKGKILARDTEIYRLGKELEVKAPVTVIEEKKCVCHKNREESELVTTNKQLEHLLEETQSKQHEAMYRAMCLADRIKELENQLRNKSPDTCLTRQIHDLENQISELGEKIQCLNDERSHLQMELLCTKKDKELLTERVRYLTIENRQSQCSNVDKLIQDLKEKNQSLWTEKSKLEVEHSSCQKEKESLMDQLKQLESLQRPKSPKTVNVTTSANANINKGAGDWEDRLQAQFAELARRQEDHCAKAHTPRWEEEILQLQKRIAKAEEDRDYYQKEYSRLNDKVRDLVENAGASVSLRRELHSKEEEIIHLLRKVKELECLASDKRLSPRPSPSELSLLRDENSSLRQRVNELNEANRIESTRFQAARLNLEERLEKCAEDRMMMINKQSELLQEIHNLKNDVDKHKTHIASLTSENSRIAVLNAKLEEMQRELRNSQDKVTVAESELNEALARIKLLESQIAALKSEIDIHKRQIIAEKDIVAKLDKERDELIFTLDEKTEAVENLRVKLQTREEFVGKLQDQLSNLKAHVSVLEQDKSAFQYEKTDSEREINNLRHQIQTLNQSVQGLTSENRKLLRDMDALTKDHQSTRADYEQALKEADDLRVQLQIYVTEVKRIEDLLQVKESEREDLLNQFRSLSVEASHLESNNHILESESRSHNDSVGVLQDRLRDAEAACKSKDDLLDTMQSKITQLSLQVNVLEKQLSDLTNENVRLELNLKTSNDIARALEEHKQSLQLKLKEHEVLEMKLRDEIGALKFDKDRLEQTFSRERQNIAAFENVITSSRQEILQTLMENDSLKKKVEELNQTILDLKSPSPANT